MSQFKVGDWVYKNRGNYGGPGIVRAATVLPDGKMRYMVGHMIADGFGEFLHIYAQGDLCPLSEQIEREAAVELDSTLTMKRAANAS